MTSVWSSDDPPLDASLPRNRDSCARAGEDRDNSAEHQRDCDYAQSWSAG
jgi:hypothetical protein